MSIACPLQQVRHYAELIKFEHTIFALPFALSAMLLALPPGAWPAATTLLWVLLAMVGGRTYAMALNRLIDAEIDARNPRTQQREIPAGKVSRRAAWMLAGMALGLFALATAQLPPLCLQLWPIAVVTLTIYSFMKRFSSAAHLVLGLALGFSAVGGWVAVTGALAWPPVLFGLAVACWVAGFDILYACQDVDFDRAEGLHSIPAWLGVRGAFRVSRLAHALTIGFLLAAGALLPAPGWGYWAGVAAMAGFLVWEHRLVSPDDLSRLDAAFFTMNGRASVAFCLLIFVAKVLG